ncbi:MAG: PstS family phosphate ABC transporter substrate-binding protein [Clostridium sp.]|uniref:PstS family phosphate ABC transporter substrate-binding protein n=1 Tax=Clostridium sp. TaxID=1506 RepID=UPI002FC66728
MGKIKGLIISTVIGALALSFVGCSENQETTSNIQGQVRLDGSSTVAPIAQAVTEEFNKEFKDVKVSIGVSGTGGGFKKFTAGETDINNASRKIKEEELKKASEKNIHVTGIEVAYDGIAVVVNKENTWATDITSEELKLIWDEGSKIKMWSDIRKGWPQEEIRLYGPGTDSGTFEYFTEAINGKAKRIRTDFTASEDDNVLVQGVSNDKYALGYFGAAYYEENIDKLKALTINGVALKSDTIANKQYSPLSRPLYIYVSSESVKRPEVIEYLNFFMNNVKDLVSQVGYFPLEDSKYENAKEEIHKLTQK